MFRQNKKFLPYNNSLNARAKELRNNPTTAERKLWYEYFRSHKYHFIRQKVVGNYIIDFYSQKLKLGIEIDGGTHLGDKNEEYDKNRTEKLNILGIKILRFWNDDVLKGLNEIENIIEKEIEKII